MNFDAPSPSATTLLAKFNNTLLRDCEIGLSTVMIDKNFFGKKVKFPNLKTLY